MRKEVPCPECGSKIAPAVDAFLGEILQCPDCGVELEVTGLEPLTLELAPDVEEDWGE